MGSSVVSMIGAAIAPGSKDIYRLIVATVLIGVGFSSVGLAFAVPSEILPRKWRPSESTTPNLVRPRTAMFVLTPCSLVSQAMMNIAACLGAVTGPLVIGAFTKQDVTDGWKNFYVSQQLHPLTQPEWQI